jgi:hypothetical protein
MMAKKPGTKITVRKRGPWKPERGQRVQIVRGFSVPEWAGFTIVVVVLAVVIAWLASRGLL